MYWALKIRWPRACPTAAQHQNRCVFKSRVGRRFCHEISAPVHLCTSLCLRCRWATGTAGKRGASSSRSGRVIRGETAMRRIFLGLAIWGAIHPMYYFITWFRAEGWSLSDMVQAWHVNAASSGLVWDLTIALWSCAFVHSRLFSRRGHSPGNWHTFYGLCRCDLSVAGSLQQPV